MILIATGHELRKRPSLQKKMFQDRAEQFANRLGWNVVVNEQGEERDQYDELNPVYVIAMDQRERHLGSMRFMPTTGRTMVNEHFSHLNNGIAVRHPRIWECTRFCVCKGASKSTAVALMAAGANLMLNLHLKFFVGVFDRRMQRVYRRIGVLPVLHGSSRFADETASLGMWSFNRSVYEQLLARSELNHAQLELGFVNSVLAKSKQAQAG